MAVSKRGPQGLESRDMSGELEYPQDPQNAEYLRSLGDVLEGVLGGEEVEGQGQVEGQDAQQVDDVQERHHEL